MSNFSLCKSGEQVQARQSGLKPLCAIVGLGTYTILDKQMGFQAQNLPLPPLIGPSVLILTCLFFAYISTDVRAKKINNCSVKKICQPKTRTALFSGDVITIFMEMQNTFLLTVLEYHDFFCPF